MKNRYIFFLTFLLLLVGVTGCQKATEVERTERLEEVSGLERTDDEQSTEATEGLEVSQTVDMPQITETSQSTASSALVAKEVSAVTNTDTPIVTSPPPASVSLVMVGDILLHTPVEESAVRPDGSYNFDAIFANVKEQIRAADLALVNQEVIIGGEELGISGYPAFNAPYEVGDALVDAGFDVVCHGTNHALDKGRKGLLNCLAFWESNYPEIGVLGIYGSQEAQDSIYVYEQDGIKIALLNYTYGTNGIVLPEDMPFAVNMLEEKRVIADIQKAEEIADFTVVCPHWGTEYELGISSQQEKWAQIFLENGVDLVLGTHPHVIEPMEWLVDEATGHEMLVYYSLGNFVNWTSGTGDGVANRMVGGMAQVRIEVNENGEVIIAEYDVEPLVCHVEEGMDGVRVYFLEDYSVELAGKNEIKEQDSAFSLEYCLQLCNQVWGCTE